VETHDDDAAEIDPHPVAGRGEPEEQALATSATNDFSAIVASERPAPPKGAFEKERIGQCTIYRPTAWLRR
jgi:hypothetical protein